MVFQKKGLHKYIFETASSKEEVFVAFKIWSDTYNELTDPASLKSTAFYQKVTFKGDNTIVIQTLATSKGSLGNNGETLIELSPAGEGTRIVVTLKPEEILMPIFFLLLLGGGMACMFIKLKNLMSDLNLILTGIIWIVLSCLITYLNMKITDKGLKQYMIFVLGQLSLSQAIQFKE